MAGMLDHQVGWIPEVTYNTGLTVTRFGEWLAGNGMDFDPNVVQGKGLRVGSAVDRAGRRVPLVGKAEGKLMFELCSKGFGTLFKGCWGTGVSTLVSGSTYQELFTAALAGTYLDSFTVQEGLVKPGGTVDAYTYAGCTFTGFELEMPADGIGTLSVDVDGRSLTTATGLATATYPATPTLFAGGLPITGAMTVGGTLTVPVAIVMGSTAGGTAVPGIKSWTLSVDNGADTEREVIGGRNQPTIGRREIKLKTEVEYDALTGAVFRDLLLSQASTPILLNSFTAETLTVGTAQLQLALPAAFIDSGPIPQPGEGETVTTEIEWSILDNLISIPAYMAMRTADVTL